MKQSIPFAAFLTLISFAALAETHFIDEWPRDLDKVPCGAWKRNANGSWTQIDPIKVNGGLTLTGNTFSGLEAKLLDRKCSEAL